ncbi:GNAT family N-acetyltransferase [Kocuria palustris]|uniref:GNAT family N-acetyltransferase n=1 Tax=Kocuria palustris TaxID=71999 RepID=UPI0011A0F899|nr:GNAT family N-acetyltransferase [Kocuria palustris]
MSASGQVVIERAEPRDAAVLHEIARRTFPDATPPDADPAAIDEFVASSLSEEIFRGHIDDPGSRVLIARTGGAAVGYALLLLDRVLPAGEDPGPGLPRERGLFLSKLYLLPEARGSGASRALLQACCETGRRIGADLLWLQVNEHNARANAFYERMGLRRVGAASFRLGPRVHRDHVRAVAL